MVKHWRGASSRGLFTAKTQRRRGKQDGDPTLSENRLVDRIRKRAGSTPGMVLGIGDDCAVLRARAGEDLLFTSDMLIEDVHFRRETHRAADVGWKAIARGLSDIAAMGGTPR